MKTQNFMSGTALWITVFVLSFLPCCSEKALENRTVKEEEVLVSSIENLVKEWEAMWNAYDLSKVDSLFLNDARLTYFSSEKEGVIRGFEAVKKHHEGFGFEPGGKVQESKLWVDDIEVDFFGGTAIVTGIWYFQRESEERMAPQRGPLTFVYVKEEPGYRLAHLNFAEYAEAEE